MKTLDRTETWCETCDLPIPFELVDTSGIEPMHTVTFDQPQSYGPDRAVEYSHPVTLDDDAADRAHDAHVDAGLGVL